MTQPGNSEDTNPCWCLAHPYQVLLNTLQCPRGEEKVSKLKDRPAGAVATETSAEGTADSLKNHSVPVSVTYTQKKKCIKSVCPVRHHDDEPGQSGEEVKELEIITDIYPCNNRVKSLELRGCGSQAAGTSV